MNPFTLHHGNCIDILKQLPDASVDMVLTDPPYVCHYRDRRYSPLRLPAVVVRAPMLSGCSLSPRPMLLQFALSSLRKERYRLLSSCADGSQGLPTTPRRGNALGASPGGRHCQSSRAR
jgi:hypothetical protein